MNLNGLYFEEPGYIRMIKDILEMGVKVPDRTGVGSIALFDAKVVYEDVEEEFPFSTIRPAPLRMAFEEFWMFLRGETQTKQLEEKGIYFWKGNTSREFLDKRGLKHLNEGDMGSAYGHQFRRFGDLHPNDPYYDYDDDWPIRGVDQLWEVYESLIDSPFGRRHYVTLWNPIHLDDMALTPCWHSHQFVILPDEFGEKRLHLKLINRSLDSIFGFSFAVQQYALYQKAMAKLLGIKAGSLACDLTHVHIYNNQIEYAEELVNRNFGENGSIEINKELNSLWDLINLKWDDIKVENLLVNTDQFDTPKPDMAV